MVWEVAGCNVIYVDRRVRHERVVGREILSDVSSGDQPVVGGLAEDATVLSNTQALLSVFKSVSVHNSGPSCVASLLEISTFDPSPTVLLLDVPLEEMDDNSSEDDDRQDSGIASSEGDEQLYGIALLRHVKSDMENNLISQNILPVAFLTDPSKDHTNAEEWTAFDEEETWVASKLLDQGAVDILSSPFTKEMSKGLSRHCYRMARAAQQKRREQKRSWVGMDADLEDEERERKNNVRVADGYAYLREKMVSDLMSDIFKPSGPKHSTSSSKIRITPARLEIIKDCVGRWDFSAHDFSDDELLQCAFEMFMHAFTMPEVEEWRIPAGQLTDFLYQSRKAYNDHVPYHNFRHVVDVLQAVFYFLLSLGSLPHYMGAPSAPRPVVSNSVSAILRPFDALTLLIVAIGHDVGHPGVNNAFLVTLRAPLAQMYNDRSVLESFHCAAFSQVLRKHWFSTQSTTEMRRLMIDAILATDMGLHFDYMNQLEKLRTKLIVDGGVGAWDEKAIIANRSLLCTLLIKCADISNVARKYDIAVQWASILTDEFSRQASLETDLKIPSSLAVIPTKASSLAVARSQVGFMNLFAAPLFQSVTDIMPEMHFGIDEINRNTDLWKKVITDCTENGDRPFIAPKPARHGNGSNTSVHKVTKQPSIPTMRTPEKIQKNGTKSAANSPSPSQPVEQPLNTNGSGTFAGRSKSLPRSVGGLIRMNRGQRTPESTEDQQPVYQVLVTSHPRDLSDKSSIPRSPQSPDMNGGFNRNRGMDTDGTSFISQTPSSPPSLGEHSRNAATVGVRQSRSRFNLAKVFRRRKADAASPPKLPTDVS